MISYASAGGSQIYYNKSIGEVMLIEDGKISQLAEIPETYKQLSFQNVFIIGYLKLKLNSYMIIVDDWEKVGEILDDSIGRIISYKILPVNNKISSNLEEIEYLDLIKFQLDKNEFYFSITGGFDLTNNCQLQYNTKLHEETAVVGKIGINEEFWWNKYLSQSLIEEFKVNKQFVTPIINGYFKSEFIKFDNHHKSLNYILITRKSINRSGTRYFRRGIDDEGNVANFNETEQIIITKDGNTGKDDQLLSFLQIRGSVPIYWTEVNNLRYKPNLIISNKNSIDATTKHFHKITQDYGDVYCINLVNNKGYELPVKNGYESIINSLTSNLRSKLFYVYFDFHHECKNMRFENVEKLIHTIEPMGFTNNNYFHYDLHQSKVVNLQTKIIRTNCMDCLDRTNVVQSIFSRWILQHQLSILGYLPDESIPWKSINHKFNFIFQNIWADNADAVSNSYSSTPALKTDFTRLGKRTTKGALNDLNNSIVRYYNNNLKDGFRQDSFDLFLGKFRPFEHPENPFIDYRPNYIQLLPYLLTTSILILFSLIFYPKGSMFQTKNLLTIACCLAFQFKSVDYILKNSYQYVNWPNLVPVGFLNKLKVNDANGNIIGYKFEHAKDFKIQSKKSN